MNIISNLVTEIIFMHKTNNAAITPIESYYGMMKYYLIAATL